MTEIEQAIKAFESFVQYCEENPRESKLVDEFDLRYDRLALKALKEKAEREKGCEHCKEKVYMKTIQNTMSNLAPLTETQALRNKLIDLTGEVYIPISTRFCPMCGKRLVSE